MEISALLNPDTLVIQELWTNFEFRKHKSPDQNMFNNIQLPKVISADTPTFIHKPTPKHWYITFEYLNNVDYFTINYDYRRKILSIVNSKVTLKLRSLDEAKLLHFSLLEKYTNSLQESQKQWYVTFQHNNLHIHCPINEHDQKIIFNLVNKCINYKLKSLNEINLINISSNLSTKSAKMISNLRSGNAPINSRESKNTSCHQCSRQIANCTNNLCLLCQSKQVLQREIIIID